MDLEVLARVFLWFSLPLGLAWGSFLNVCIHRLPLGESVIFPRSRCPSCRRMIRAVDNLPILSYLLLGGRCRDCRARIPLRYPLVEAAAGLFTFLLALERGPSLAFLAGFLFVSAMLVLVFTDLDHQLLPNRVTLTGTAAGLALSLAAGPPSPLESLASAAGGWLLIVGVAQLYYLLRRTEGMGMGDAKMMALVGAFLGWQGALLVLFLASLLGALAGLGLMAAGRGGLQARLPFGSFLGLAGLAALFWGRPIVGWYISLLH